MKRSDASLLVIDHGLFLSLAIKLIPDFKRVLYYSPWEKGFPILNDCVIGDGFEGIQRVEDIWDEMADIDIVMFPDLQHSGLQKHLESIGKRVWGSRNGDDLELKRMLLKKTQEEVGLATPEHKAIRGLDELRDFLKREKDVFVKISKYRGIMESFHHIDYDHSLPLLDNLAVQLGPLQNEFPFVVEWPIEATVEVGYDGFSIDGHYPNIGIQGIEQKDKGLIAVVQDYDELPVQVRAVNDALAPVLAGYEYRNFLSTEIRVAGEESAMIDITCRAGIPSIESQMELWENLADIIWEGAIGNMVEPEPVAKFAVEVMVNHKDDKNRWRILEVPEGARDSIKPYSACFHDGLYCFPPFSHSSDTVASIVATGNNLEEAIEALKERANMLKNQPVTIPLDSVYDMLKTIQEAEEEGIEFSNQQIPEPETALE